MKTLRKQIKKATRRDKEQYYEEMAAKAEKASSMGDQKEMFRVLRTLTGGRSGAVDLRGEDEEKWTGFFKELLGKDKFDLPKAIKEKRAWSMAHEWIRDKSKYEKPWETKLGPPEMEEFSAAVKKCKNDKGVNACLLKHSQTIIHCQDKETR